MSQTRTDYNWLNHNDTFLNETTLIIMVSVLAPITTNLASPT